jgi:alpha-L-rhamnosidase
MLMPNQKIFSLLQLLIFLAFACSTPKAEQEAQSDDDLSGAAWISSPKALPSIDSLLYEVQPSPLFRKVFTTKKEIKAATLYITAAGYYQASINGQRVGINYLDPAWTNFKKRVYYSEYDLTDAIKSGDNCLGVTLGNGFYNPLPLKMWGRRNLRDALPLGKPSFIASLKIEYKDGKTETIKTDNSWRFAEGPIRKNNVYLGEIYDARQEIIGWTKPDFQDQAWETAVTATGPGGQLQQAFFPAIQVTDVKKPVSINQVTDGKYLVDMGVNFTGTYRIRLQGQPGDTVSFRFGERIYDNGELNPMTTVVGQIKRAGVGGPGAPAIAWQEDTFIFGAQPAVSYQPEFTFHTYRYMEISGLEQAPSLSDIEGLALNTAVADANHFTTSSTLLGDIQEITERTFLANLTSVQSDCPAREKFGYGGDLNATAESFIYNFDMQDFYRKTIYDWVDAMNDSVFIDTAPYVGLQYCGISWESAFITTQYQLFLYYNDTAIVRELYDLDLEWMEKAARIHPKGLVEQGLSDHESLAPVPVELTGTTHYLQCARMMQEFAAVMGDQEKEDQFAQLEKDLTAIVLEKFWENSVAGPINRQTLFATLLYHDIIPTADKSRAADSLLAAIAKADGHFITGIFGTKYILEALSKTGHSQKAYDIVNSRDYPGWGHMVDQGATTLWETWKESDNTFSNCHPMFGSVTEWFYRYLGGIRPQSDHPGFAQFIIQPFLPEGLTQVATSYHSPYGEITSNWENFGARQQFDIRIPEGSTASVKIPADSKQTVSCTNNKQRIAPKRDETGQAFFELSGGSYTIVVGP